MAEPWDERRLTAEGFEHVYVELDWYDGPVAGIVDIDGVAHYFQRYDFLRYDVEDAPDQYVVWPVSAELVALEREQWEIFVRWNQRYEAGDAGTETHPGHGGIDPRYDELTGLLTEARQVPADAARLVAEWRFDGGEQYRMDGVRYWVRWSPVE
ncbi:hypothetical protein [Kribbella swartbergensis]